MATPQEFAQWLEESAGFREASWVDHSRGDYSPGNRHNYLRSTYALTWAEAVAKAGVPKEWAGLVEFILETGYSDPWDWVSQVRELTKS